MTSGAECTGDEEPAGDTGSPLNPAVFSTPVDLPLGGSIAFQARFGFLKEDAMRCAVSSERGW